MQFTIQLCLSLAGSRNLVDCVEGKTSLKCFFKSLQIPPVFRRFVFALKRAVLCYLFLFLFFLQMHFSFAKNRKTRQQSSLTELSWMLKDDATANNTAETQHRNECFVFFLAGTYCNAHSDRSIFSEVVTSFCLHLQRWRWKEWNLHPDWHGSK